MMWYPISILIEPDGEFELWHEGKDCKDAVRNALNELVLKEGETIHVIHVGPPKETIKTRIISLKGRDD